MKNRILAAVVAVLGLACGNVDDLKIDEFGDEISSGGKVIEAESALRVPGQYIVRLKDPVAGFSAQSNAQLSASVATKYAATVKRSFLSIPGFVATMSADRAAKLALDANVEFVEEDAVIHLSATQSGATWGLDRVDQRNLPLDSSYTYSTTASNVNAYIVDTGIRRTHADFGGRAVVGFDAINDGQNTNDCNGHGTHVAGTVAGSTWGLAKGAKLYAVRVLDCQGSGTNSGVIAGIDWVTANHVKPAVANMSLGGGPQRAGLQRNPGQGHLAGHRLAERAALHRHRRHHASPRASPRRHRHHRDPLRLGERRPDGADPRVLGRRRHPVQGGDDRLGRPGPLRPLRLGAHPQRVHLPPVHLRRVRDLHRDRAGRHHQRLRRGERLHRGQLQHQGRLDRAVVR